MGEKRWRPGDVILKKEFLGHIGTGQLINVRPQVVVADEPGYLALVSLPRITWMTRDDPGRAAMSLEERVELYLKEQLTHEWRERTAGDGIALTIHPVGVAHSIRLVWGPDSRFLMWYLNLEDPHVRIEQGIETNDHTLDVLVAPDLTWSWKDEPEFEALVAAGKIAAEKAQAIRAEGQRAIARLEARAWPYNEPWPEWRPDPSWEPPKVSDYWTPPPRMAW